MTQNHIFFIKTQEINRETLSINAEFEFCGFIVDLKMLCVHHWKEILLSII
ncbi:hypothetical protein NARC_40089 [Candidatus Nitrosocosmicus arcticus]|uniref:Uncharacterized protein n=1 Tax=Candidatus Nitrosocosmicus arcticus TaxID=2035267 RepID=A0A557SWZ2_9ARCH|nr:hypothetical protein NARC_40089 [Candidatus Nitrosocosmicus arcticus]